jgi:Na+-driven multidrug efflux pump
VFFVFPYFFLRIFTSDPALLAISAQYLRVDVFTFPLMAIGMGVSRVMQALGRGLPGMVINFVRIFGIAVPLAAVFVYFLGLPFIWIAYAMVLGNFIAATIAVLWMRNTLSKIG